MAGLSTRAGAPVVKLYHEKSMILPDVSRVLACLYEKNIQFETVKDSYKDILRLQASRSVPVPFYDGPTFLQESRAICRYIAETYEQCGYPFLLGKDVLERASIEQWLRHEEHAFDPPSRALFCHLAFPVHDDDDDDINKGKRKLEEVLEVYEQRLGESEFLAGNKFTLADLVHLPNTHHIVTSEFAYLYDSRKNVQRWWNTISTRDSWQQVLRDMNSVEEEYQMELERQEEQWQTEPPQTYVSHTIRIDPRKTTGPDSRTVSSHTDEAATPHEIDERASVDPRFDKPAPYTKPTTDIPQTSAHTDLGTSPATEAGETSSDLRGGVQPSYGQEHVEQAKITSADRRADTRLPEHVASKDVQDENALPAQPRGTQEVTKDARQDDQKRVIEATPQQQPSESQEDTHNTTSEDDRFATKRLREMMEESDKAAQAVKSQPTDFQPSKEEETSYIYKKPSDVQDTTILDDSKTASSPSTGTQAPDFPTGAAERRVASPTKGGMPHDDSGATKPQKSPSMNEQEKIPVVPSQAQPASSGQASKSSKEVSPDDGLGQLSTINQWRQAFAPPPTKQAAPDAPSNDELAKTAGVDKRTPPSTPKQTPRDDRNALATGRGAARGIGNEQSDKSSITDERAPKMTPRQAAPSDTQRASSAPTQEGINGARGTNDDMFGKTSRADQSNTPAIAKQTTVQGEIPDVRGNSDDDRDMKLAADEKEATNRQKPVSSSQQTTEPIKGTTPTSYGITGDDLAKKSRADERPTPSSKVQAPASDSASTALQGDPVSSQAPPPSSFTSTRNKENGISEAGQTNKVAPDELPGLSQQKPRKSKELKQN
ncbi:hypothetical protein E2562_007187 [Oryza meyeriana var. granulata]|uniref:glutathione transferase n=1 Tax=Oryza meyeriana var. granulata TaxID=110450 RepID=A0A6G1CDV7_9ORYZ|nr:hypothetical protein E2562_007187 [Oryza meyeriana var. granulata]